MSVWMTAIGWALIHFVWQGAVLAAAAWGLLVLCRRQAASVRYGIACGALAMMVLAAVGTAVMAMNGINSPEEAYSDFAGAPPLSGANLADDHLSYRFDLFNSLAGVQARAAVEAAFPWIVSMWLAGVALLLARSGAGWWRVRRLHRVARLARSSRWQMASNRLASRLGLRRFIPTVELSGIDVPLVVGCLRPIIVLPIAAFSHLTPAQADAILAHELAHVRRHDYLINLLQTVAETLLFYHPAVWWISGRIRDERENCCDDVAVEVCGDPVGYARALAELEEQRLIGPRLAAAATGGSLLNRVRRILRVELSDDRQGSHWTILAVFAAALIAVGVWRVDAQTPQEAAQTPKFEVAAVRPNKATDIRSNIQIQPGGRFTATNIPLRALIVHAYNLMPFQLVGPDWVDSERFDVVAKAEHDFPPAAPGGGPAPQQLMLQALLAERFALATHRDTQEMAVYSMELARADRRLGPQLKPSTAECKEISGGVAPPTGIEKTTCGIRVMPGQLAAGGVPLSAMAFPLSMFVQRMVIDRTGLTGAFDYELRWTPDMIRQRMANAPAGQSVRINGVDIDPNGPSIFTALQEQLGLKLESTRGPVETLVIDHVERPTAD